MPSNETMGDLVTIVIFTVVIWLYLWRTNRRNRRRKHYVEEDQD